MARRFGNTTESRTLMVTPAGHRTLRLVTKLDRLDVGGDSRQVAAAVLRDGRWSLRAIDATDGHETIVIPPLPPNVYVRYPEWSPKGDVMVFERGDLRGNIWTMSIQ